MRSHENGIGIPGTHRRPPAPGRGGGGRLRHRHLPGAGAGLPEGGLRPYRLHRPGGAGGRAAGEGAAPPCSPSGGRCMPGDATSPSTPTSPPPGWGRSRPCWGARYVITDQAHRALAEQLFPPAAVLDIADLLAAPLQPAGWRPSARGSSTPTPCTSTSPPAPPASPRGWW